MQGRSGEIETGEEAVLINEDHTGGDKRTEVRSRDRNETLEERQLIGRHLTRWVLFVGDGRCHFGGTFG